MILSTLVWVLIAVLLYAWILYPAVILLWPARGVTTPMGDTRRGVPVSVVLAAYNEERHIGARLANLLDTIRDAPGSEILVGVDGSSDRTAEIAHQVAAKADRVHVHAFPQRRGKMSVLKDLVPLASHSILVFTDANTQFDPGALRTLFRHFTDERVGGVCGRLVLSAGRGDERGTTAAAKPRGAKAEESIYWDLEAKLKHQESRIDSCIGANGAIYAIRKRLFWSAIPANTIVDDLVIGVKVREQGYRMVYEPDAVAREEAPQTVRDEWRRRVRIGSGDFQALALCRRCLLPSYGRFAWIFFSHKVLRWFTPHALVLLLLGSALAVTAGCPVEAGARVVLYRLNQTVLVGLILGLGFGVVGRLFGGSRHSAMRFFRLLHYFLAMQAALLVGFIRSCRGNLKGYWSRTPRE